MSIYSKNSDNVINVENFGARGDGSTSDVTAVQNAVNAASNKILLFPAGGTYYLPSSITLSNSCTIDANGATLQGSGVGSDNDLFNCATSIDLKVRGGVFTDCRHAFKFTTAFDSLAVSQAEFTNSVSPLLVYAVDSSGSIGVHNCRFSNVECGVDIQSCAIKNVDVSHNRFDNVRYQTVATRAAPLDKKIVAGFWYQSTAGNTSAVCSNNYVEDVVGPPEGEVPAEPEVHGLGVTLALTDSTDCVFSGNVIKNIVGVSGGTEGNEGLLGRSRRVIIDSNHLYNAGSREACIYAKGSNYHKISNNIVEMSLDRDDWTNTRGVISTGSGCDITDNKFINVYTGIYSRAVSAQYVGNEFINIGNICIALALESGAEHALTVVDNNRVDSHSISLFRDVTAGAEQHGDFILRNNVFKGTGYLATIKGGLNILINDNFVKRTPTGTDRELISISAPASGIFIQNNQFVEFENVNPDGRIITGSSTNTPRMFITNNYFGVGTYALWLRDQVYEDLIVRDNQYFDCSAVNYTNVDVSGVEIVVQTTA